MTGAPAAASRTRALAIATSLAMTVLAAGCGTSQASFDPAGPCTTDGRAPGAYPDLQAKLPTALGGVGPATGTGSATADLKPTTVDSGRTCTQAALGPLWAHGVRELRFAGATWDYGSGDATVSAYFATPAGQPTLDPKWMEEFYEVGARASSKTENLVFTTPTIEPAGEVWRLDTLNDLSFQTVVVWSATDGGVRVAIVATRVEPDASRRGHDAAVELAVSQSTSRTQP
ncbi:MAG TPA: hypothetical protein VM451_11310 [Candidatus Limnocylindria bacterium]|nr:hypothetical protein [Candidatus Limnocylindria bacterium]